MNRYFSGLIFLLLLLISSQAWADNALVFQTDFGLKDGAVAVMKGVVFGVDSDLKMFDLTHEIPPFNIWEAAYRLMMTAGYWPSGTVFVSVVDPGVGTDRKSVVLKTKSGHFFVSPDNGTLTLVAEKLGIESIREIDEKSNRLKGSEKSHTFHGRDIYAYTGARLASNKISFQQVGPELVPSVVQISFQKAQLKGNTLYGTIPVLDIQFGNIWSNIPSIWVEKLGVKKGEKLLLEILHKENKVYTGKAPYVNSFGDVPSGGPLIYLNSLLNLSVALNMDNFSETHGIGSGAEWQIRFTKLR